MSIADFVTLREEDAEQTKHAPGEREREMRQMENSAAAEEPSQLCQASPVTGAARLTYRVAKRAFDFTAALLLSVLLALPMAVLMLLIRLDSPGPAIYRQERLGKDGKPFTILKLRTMRLDAEKTAPGGPRQMTAAAPVWGAFCVKLE